MAKIYQKDFEELNKKISQAFILVLWILQQTFKVDKNTSWYAMGSMLM